MLKKVLLLKCLLGFALCWSWLSLGAADPYKVLVLGDLHYDGARYHAPDAKPTGYVEMWKKKTPALLKDAASRLDNTFPFVIQLGDLSTGWADSLEHQKEIVRDAFWATKKFFPNHKFLVTKGNHDVRIAFKTGRKYNNQPAAEALLPLIAKEAGKKELKTGNWSITYQKDLYIFVDGFESKFDTVKFMEKELKDHPDARYVFLLTHLPVFPASYGDPTWLLPHYEEIAGLLAGRNAIILGGHTHAFSTATFEYPGKGTVTQLLTSSVALNWNCKDEFKVRSKDYTAYDAAMTKKEKPYAFEKAFPGKNYQNFLIYPGRFAGYTVLEISEEGVTALICLGPKREPYRLTLLNRTVKP